MSTASQIASKHRRALAATSHRRWLSFELAPDAAAALDRLATATQARPLELISALLLATNRPAAASAVAARRRRRG